MTHERTTIRYYAKNLIQNAADVGRRVFTNRSSVIFEEEVPLVVIFFANEQNLVYVGDKFNPQKYQRNLSLAVCVIVEQQHNPDEPLNENMDGEDLIDKLCEQIEMAMFDDHFFSSALPGYNENRGDNPGLIQGVSLESTVPFEVDTKSDRELIGQKMTFMLPYLKQTYPEPRLKDFLSYFMAITKTNVTDETVDPVLIAAEGDVRS